VIAIRAEADIVAARQQGRALAAQLALGATDLALLATAISELARNILHYAGSGEVEIRPVDAGSRRGVCVIARDTGPGIPDVERALQDGYSTGGGLGLGLPGTRRIMDEFRIESQAGRGTTVWATKWAPPNGR
jgi:serine/threonine-protein kinase RsbT